MIAATHVGCDAQNAKQQPAQASHPGDAVAAKPAVPLRVWFVGEESSAPFLERQWQANSERPLTLRMLTAASLVESTNCDCDVVVFPAHLLGELIARDCLVELPGSLQSRNASSHGAAAAPLSPPPNEEAAAPVQPAAWLDQARYGRRLWGVSLSVTTPVILANFALPHAITELSPLSETGDAEQDSRIYWQSLIESLSAQSKSAQSKKGGEQLPADDHSQVDADAVFDRYMVLVASLLKRESRFGTLLDPETLKSRLRGAEFVEAAKILSQLHQANSSPQAFLGSPDAAWRALAGSDANVTIGLPPSASAEVDKVTTIQMSLPPQAPVRSGARTPRGWNSGHGLVVALTSECRQTGQAVEFVRWLTSETSRSVLGKRLAGMANESTYAPGSSAWQAQRLAQRLAGQPRLLDEPRLPGSLEYRRALGEKLVRMLRGEQSAEEAMKGAASAWDQITAARERPALRSSYEQSLGL